MARPGHAREDRWSVAQWWSAHADLVHGWAIDTSTRVRWRVQRRSAHRPRTWPVVGRGNETDRRATTRSRDPPGQPWGYSSNLPRRGAVYRPLAWLRVVPPPGHL